MVKRSTKLMKTKVVLLMAVMSISLFSVGFSSWITVGSEPPKMALETEKGEINDYSSVVTSVNFEKLQYCEHGFIDNEEIGTQGYITSIIVFNTLEAKALMPNNINENGMFTFNATFTLNDANFDLINQFVSVPTAKVIIPSTGIIPIIKITSNLKNDNKIILDVNFSNIGSNVNYMQIALNYLIDVNSLENFTSIYSSLNEVKFSLSLEIKE